MFDVHEYLCTRVSVHVITCVCTRVQGVCMQKLELGEPDWCASGMTGTVLLEGWPGASQESPEKDASVLCLPRGAFSAVLITREFAIRGRTRGMHSKGKEEGAGLTSLAFTLLCASH